MKNLTIIITIALMTGFMFADTTKTTNNSNSDQSNCTIVASSHCADTMDLTADEQKLHTSMMKKIVKSNYCSVSQPQDKSYDDSIIEEK